MTGDRFVVLGLAHVRSGWFPEVSRWATTAAVPIDFVKCVSMDELRARLASGRAFSAIVADAGMAGIDRDLIDRAREIGCATVLVDDGTARRDLRALGASGVLPTGFDRDQLLAVLDEHASAVGGAPPLAAPTSAQLAGTHGGPEALRGSSPAWRGHLVAVTGAGGTGTSVAAIALAQGLAVDVRSQGRVLLADLALDADQAMLHDARDIVPGLQELVDAFRHGAPLADDLLALTYGDGAPYRVLLGLRRHRDWTVLRPRALHAALDGLRRAFTHVVADIDPDLEGEAECGSADVEDRNLLARTSVGLADAVVVTGLPGVQGIHRLVRTISSVVDHGVPPERILPTITRAPRGARSRAELARTVAALLDPVLGDGAGALSSPLFLADHRRLDTGLRDGVGVPTSMATAVAGGVHAILRRTIDLREPTATGPQPIVPGSLGAWATSQEAAG